jgi:predicted nucleic acid-binding protein
VTRIEALGFWDLNAGEASLLAEFFRGAKQFDLTEQVIIRAIFLRQTRKMRLGDAIIGATAVENDLELWTANTKDFAGIEGLRLHNPVENM